MTVQIAYGARLSSAVAEHGPLCVGIDPHPSLLRAWGLPVDVTGLERCARTMVAAAAGRAAQVKPQSAFYEAFGSAGIAVLERVLADCRDAGLLSLLDVKRGDLGSTMDAYAAAYLSDGSSLAADAITLSPYLGIGSLNGAVEAALSGGRGVYLLAATSNPEGGAFQRAVLPAPAEDSAADHPAGADAEPRTVAQAVIEAVVGWNAEAAARGVWGSVGLVIGATIDAAMTATLDLSDVNGPLLAPGVGAQGGGADDLRRVFGPALRFVLPSSSRAVMASGPDVAAVATAIDDGQRLLAAH